MSKIFYAYGVKSDACIVVIEMLKLSGKLFNTIIYSLRTGGQIGVGLRPVINPNNLKVEGWFATSIYESGTLVLPISEIRELSRGGIAVNDHEALTAAAELVRLQPLVNLDYQLLGKPVATESKQKLGKVEDFALNIDSFFIEKLYVVPGGLKILSSKRLQVSRKQIIEITDKKIIVQDIEATVPSFFRATVPAPEGSVPA